MFKYLGREELIKLGEIKEVEFVSNDTINEHDLLEVLKKCDKELLKELITATLQMAIIGFGGKQYNQYKYNGQIKELTKLFTKMHMSYNNQQGAILNTNELTPRRLLRLFRYQIRDYLELNPDVFSYLFNKYSDMDPKYRTICFPGAEHLVENNEEAYYLYKAYKNLDDTLEKSNRQSGISERVRRVMLARKISPEIFEHEHVAKMK